MRRRRGRTWCSTRPPTPRSTPPRPTRRPRPRSTPTARRNLARVCAAARRPAGARRPPTTSSPATRTTPYEVDAPTGPRSAYGRTKLAGEQAVRRAAAGAVLGGAHRLGVRRDRRQLRQDDGPAGRRAGHPRRGRRPARLADLVAATWPPGWSRWPRAGPRRPAIYHCTNAGETTWYGLARAVFAELGADPERVRPTTHRRRSRGRRRGRPTRCCPTRPGGPPGCRRRGPGGTRCTPPSPRWAGHWGRISPV